MALAATIPMIRKTWLKRLKRSDRKKKEKKSVEQQGKLFFHQMVAFEVKLYHFKTPFNILSILKLSHRKFLIGITYFYLLLAMPMRLKMLPGFFVHFSNILLQ